jgi:hypothetical protein
MPSLYLPIGVSSGKRKRPLLPNHGLAVANPTAHNVTTTAPHQGAKERARRQRRLAQAIPQDRS